MLIIIHLATRPLSKARGDHGPPAAALSLAFRTFVLSIISFLFPAKQRDLWMGVVIKLFACRGRVGMTRLPCGVY